MELTEAAYEVMNGNTIVSTTLNGFLDKIENTYGEARWMWAMDRGIPTEAVLAATRAPGREFSYLVGTPKSRIGKHEKLWLNLPWQSVRDSVPLK